MVVAVAKAAEEGAQRDHLRLDRQHVGIRGGLRRGGRARGRRRPAEGPDRRRQAAPGAGRRRARRRHRRQLRRGARASCAALAEQDDHPVTLVNSVNPYRLEGQKTAASRSATTSAARPTSWPSRSATRATSPPTGRASATTRRPASSSRRPRMLGFQAAGAAPLVLGRRSSSPRPSPPPSGSATPRRGTAAIAARDESGGRIEAVTDDEILAAYRDLARLEGIFCEPASAACVAGRPQGRGRGRARPRRDRRVRADRPRPQGPDDRRARRSPRVHRGRADASARSPSRWAGRRRWSRHWLAELDGRRGRRRGAGVVGQPRRRATTASASRSP